MRLPDSWVQTSRYLSFSSEGICDNHPENYRYRATVGSIVDVVLAGQQGKIRTVDGERFLKTTLLPFIERAKKQKAQFAT